MRSVIALSVFALAAAGPSIKDQAHCVVDGGEAASDLMDASIFIWGAKQRCTHLDNQVKCEIDIASAVQSVASMTNTILKVAGRCGHHFNPDCGRASTRLIKAVAEISAASGGIKQKCHKQWAQPVAGGAMVGGNLPGTDWMHGASALCVLDVKNTAKNLLKVVKSFVKIDKKCKHKHSRKCGSHALKVVGALSGLGEYVAASIGDCSPASQMSHDSECAQESIMLAHALVRVAEAGTELSKSCTPKDKKHVEVDPPVIVEVPVPRLYEENHVEANANAGFANIALGAFLPVTAIVSFVAGRFYASHRSRAEQTREFMSDNE